MLGRTYRFNVYNNSGQSIPAGKINLIARRWNFAGSGVQTWEATATTLLSGTGALATGNYLATATIDNSTTAYLGGTFEFDVDMTTAAAAPNGTISLYLQRSADGGTTWPDNGQGVMVAVLNFTALNKQTIVVEL